MTENRNILWKCITAVKLKIKSLKPLEKTLTGIQLIKTKENIKLIYNN
jgi:hypothetical protein